ncbi:unnamed protein product [Paramecium sonneborni]|uniref:UBR-type domain-containing protein n=1 Tax=Paramecium sonneborni TaxID=65129 RepID=A0A8S1LTY6_9CILI|nr:unnamed protein product [Paramecium sonneborni]
MEILNEENLILELSKEMDELSDEELMLKALKMSQEEYLGTIIQNRDNGQKSLCANPIDDLELFYQCYDCCQDSSHVICKECFIPENHKGHAVLFQQIQNQMKGYCDCGDIMMFDGKQLCPKHHKFDLKVDNKQIENNSVLIKYEQFLKISFGLLYKKMEQIIDYPNDLLNNIEIIINTLKDETLDIYFNSHILHFVKIKDSIKEAKFIYRLIFRCLEIITTNNIIWSYFTGKLLRQEIQIQFNQNITISTTLLEQFLKYNIHFVESIEFEKDLSTFFPLFFQDDDFRTYFCRTVVQNFKYFYLIVNSYTLRTQKNEILKVQIYQQIKDEKLSSLIDKILGCCQIKQIINDQQINQGRILKESYFFMQRGYIEILKLYKNTKNQKCYNLFDVISDIFQKIPLINLNSLSIYNQFSYGIELMARSKEAIKGLIIQIEEILQKDINQFKLQILNPNCIEFKKLMNQSLLIYSLTRRYPCQQIKNFNQQSKFDDEEENLLYSLAASIKICSVFRNDLKSILSMFENIQSFEAQNILRIIIHYFLNNFESTFNLKCQSLLNLFISNHVLSDRNFITVLSIYIMNFTNSQEAYINILEIYGQNNQQFQQIMYHLMKRAVLNYIIFSQIETQDFYLGQQNYWKDLDNEISLQQIDIAYIQIYAFLFQDLGINDIIQSYNEISQQLKKKTNPAMLICRIAQTDYDLIQCVGSIIGNQINEQFQKGLNKLFQTIFYSQTFYQLDEMKKILKELSYENRIDLENMILSSCEINKDNGQLQLKKEFKLHIYEPIYSIQNDRIKEKINDQLQMQNDKFTEIFGSSLEYELYCYGTKQSTLTKIRYEILEAISKDINQSLLYQIQTDLENITQQNQVINKKVDQLIKMLQNNAIYINLLFLANQFFKANNTIIKNILDKIQNICQTLIENKNLNHSQQLFFQVYCSRFSIESLTQKLEDKDQEFKQSQSQTKINNERKIQLQQKFKQMKEIVNNKYNDKYVTEDSNEICLICKLTFEKNQIQFQPILIQYSNINEYLSTFQNQISFDNNIVSVHVTNCNHIFHDYCLKNQMFGSKNKNQLYQNCSLCYSPYNFIIPNPYQIKNIEIEQFELCIEAYIQSLSTENQLILEKYYQGENFQIYQFLDEILSQVLCNLIFQLLSDLKIFLEKSQHLFLQKIVALIKILYKYLDINTIDKIKLNENEKLIKILKIVQKNIIKENNLNQFQQELQLLLNPKFEVAEILYEVFTKQQIITQINNELLPFDIIRIKNQFKNKMINFLTYHFSTFLEKHYLSPCKKKNCLMRTLKLETKFQGQCICLICFKKICSQFCGQVKQKQSLGNLQRHSAKNHQGKSIFIYVENSMLILMHSPLYMQMANHLFTNGIGEPPVKGSYKLQHYKKFQLNLKIIDQIVDIIVEEKYLNRLDATSENKITSQIQ